MSGYDERLEIYLSSIADEDDPFLERLEAEARADDVPVIRKDVQRMLRFLLALHKPGTILEIGTAVGFSSVFFCRHSAASVVTIENFERRIACAEKNIAASGFSDRITLLKGDAGEILPRLCGPFDMVFLDAAQGQYIHFLPDLLRLLRCGGLLAADNVMIGGDLLESHYAVARRKRTIHKRMREYLCAVMKGEGLATTVLPVGDGLALTVKQ